MPDPTAITTGQARYDAGEVAHVVGDDMAAIFGPRVRLALDPPMATPASVRSGGRPGRTMAICGGALALALTAGALVGNNTLDVPAATGALHASKQVARSARRLAARQVPDRASPPASVASSGVAHDGERPSIDDVSSPTPHRPASPADAIVAVSPPPPASVAAVHQPTVTDQERIPLAPMTGRPRGCDDDTDECLSHRVDTAGRRLANVFDQAAAAGVRGRVLRDYQRLWLRAQDEAVDRPFYSLRVYEMITSDLYTFIDDAERSRR